MGVSVFWGNPLKWCSSRFPFKTTEKGTGTLKRANGYIPDFPQMVVAKCPVGPDQIRERTRKMDAQQGRDPGTLEGWRLPPEKTDTPRCHCTGVVHPVVLLGVVRRSGFATKQPPTAEHLVYIVRRHQANDELVERKNHVHFR